jgi:uncharacterized protein YqjF (DUF2071 family)
MSLRDDGKVISYQSTRTHRRAAPAAFEARYAPTGEVYHSTPGTLEFWFTERYCLYSADRRTRVWKADIHHARWPLQPASSEVVVNTMTDPLKVKLPVLSPVLHFARSLEVIAWKPELVATN